MTNFYKVEPKEWRSLKTNKAKAMYNEVMDKILMEQYEISPIEKPIHHNDWWKICHKIAMIAGLATLNIDKIND
mgnify:CR=1 FL=1